MKLSGSGSEFRKLRAGFLTDFRKEARMEVSTEPILVEDGSIHTASIVRLLRNRRSGIFWILRRRRTLVP